MYNVVSCRKKSIEDKNNIFVITYYTGTSVNFTALGAGFGTQYLSSSAFAKIVKQKFYHNICNHN